MRKMIAPKESRREKAATVMTAAATTAARRWLVKVGLWDFREVLGLTVDVAVVDGELVTVVQWPDGMARIVAGSRRGGGGDGGWVGADRHRGLVWGGAGGGDGWSWGDGRVMVCETVVDAELLCLAGVRAVWCGAVGMVRLRRLLPVSPGAYICARRRLGWGDADLWEPAKL